MAAPLIGPISQMWKMRLGQRRGRSGARIECWPAASIILHASRNPPCGWCQFLLKPALCKGRGADSRREALAAFPQFLLPGPRTQLADPPGWGVFPEGLWRPCPHSHFCPRDNTHCTRKSNEIGLCLVTLWDHVSPATDPALV